MNLSPQYPSSPVAAVGPAKEQTQGSLRLIARSKVLSVAILLGLCGLIFFARLHTYNEPLERDIAIYAVIAHEIVHGKALYSDFWDHKPPAIYATYAVAELIAGYGRDSIFLLNILAAVATTFACYLVGSAASGGRMGGLIAAAFWALCSGDLAIEGNQPNTEVFLNAFLTAGFAIFVCRKKRNLGLTRALFAGLLFAVASLYKPVVVVQPALLGLVYIAFARTGARKGAIGDVAMIAATGVGIWALVFGYFAAGGHAAAFIESVFTYNRWYSGSIWQNLRQITSWPMVSPDVLAVGLSMATLSGAGLILGLIFGPRRQWIVFLAFVIATHIAVLLPGRFFPHYYQLWLPPLAIGSAWAITLLKRILPGRLSWLSYGVAVVACGILVMVEAPYYQLSAENWSVQKYGSIFLETDRLANKIDSLLPPGGTFYEWGNESGLYFTSGRRPPSGIVFAYPMMAGPLAESLSRRAMNDLERSRPDIIVFDDWTLKQTGGHPVVSWLRKNYRPFSRTNVFWIKQSHPPFLTRDMFVLFVRKDAKLTGQLASAAH